MDSMYTSLLIFLVFTILYYLFKPKPTVEILYSEDNSVQSDFSKKKYTSLLIYFLVILILQFIMNASVLINKCGGSVSKNIGAGALITFIPWILIFGGIILVIIMFPGFKSAFSNVIGYFAVSGKANNILAELLVNTDTKADESIPAEKKAALEKAAEAIVKLCGNVSIMINQIVPENFKDYWALLEPLMKEKYSQPEGKGELLSLKEQLLGVVVLRDNIGEALWYIYTAILLTSIVQFSLVSRGCQKDPAEMLAAHQEFLDQEQKDMAENNKTVSQGYIG